MTTIFVGHNFFGSGNFGDELMLKGFLTAARRHPKIEITICTPYDLEGERRRFPEVRWLPDGDAVRKDALRAADLWLGLGGTPFQLDSGDWFLDHNERERARCAELRKPMFFLGVGCESSTAAADPRSVALLATAEHVWMRDALSAAMVRPFANASRLSAGGDLAHLTFAAAPPRLEVGVVGLLLAFERREQIALSELAAFVERRPPGSTRWLVQETRPLPYSERSIFSDLRPAVRAKLSVTDFDFATGSVGEYLRAVGAPETMVTSRYHGTLAAAWHRSRIVVVARSPKLRGIAEELGLPQIGCIGSRAHLEAALEQASAVPHNALVHARERAARMCDDFFAACAALPTRSVRRSAAPHPGEPAEPLPLRSLRTTVALNLPRTLRAGETVTVLCTVTNRSDAIYRSAPPNPVQLCYRWYDAGGAAVCAGTWLHTPLSRPLQPGESDPVQMRIAAPESPGNYTLAVTLLQENVAWFDDVDPANGARGAVTIPPL